MRASSSWHARTPSAAAANARRTRRGPEHRHVWWAACGVKCWVNHCHFKKWLKLHFLGVNDRALQYMSDEKIVGKYSFNTWFFSTSVIILSLTHTHVSLSFCSLSLSLSSLSSGSQSIAVFPSTPPSRCHVRSASVPRRCSVRSTRTMRCARRKRPRPRDARPSVRIGGSPPGSAGSARVGSGRVGSVGANQSSQVGCVFGSTSGSQGKASFPSLYFSNLACLGCALCIMIYCILFSCDSLPGKCFFVLPFSFFHL